MSENDIMTVLMYNKGNMKRCINRKCRNSINLDDNMENFMFNKHIDVDLEGLNFYQRFDNYLNETHPDDDKINIKMRQFTERQLIDTRMKNLAIAFTSIDEWKKSSIDFSMKNFFDRFTIDSFDEEDSIKCWFVILVFDSSYKVSFAEEELDDYDNSHLFKNIPTLDWLKNQIDTKKYPITLIEISDYDDSLNKAIEFIKTYIKTSKNKPLGLSFQSILN